MQENNPAPVTPVQPSVVLANDQRLLPAQAGKTNNFLIILLSILLFLSVSIAGFFAFQTQKLVSELRSKNEELRITPTLEPTTEPIVTTDPTADWKTYSLSEVNASLKLPPELESSLELKKETNQGEVGSEVCYNVHSETFACSSYQGKFSIKLVSSNFVVGRESSFFDINGYRKSENLYEYKMFQKYSLLPQDLAQEKINASGARYLIVKGEDKLIDRAGDMVMFPINGTPGKGNIGAIINTTNPLYSGVTIFVKLTSSMTQETFDQILSTFKFTN